jgi:hypothetical protein
MCRKFAITAALAIAVAAPAQGLAKGAPVVFKSRPAMACKQLACTRGEASSTALPFAPKLGDWPQGD